MGVVYHQNPQAVTDGATDIHMLPPPVCDTSSELASTDVPPAYGGAPAATHPVDTRQTHGPSDSDDVSAALDNVEQLQWRKTYRELYNLPVLPPTPLYGGILHR